MQNYSHVSYTQPFWMKGLDENKRLLKKCQVSIADQKPGTQGALGGRESVYDLHFSELFWKLSPFPEGKLPVPSAERLALSWRLGSSISGEFSSFPK